LSYVKDNGLIPLALVNTHGHFDHIGAVSELKKELGLSFYIHKDDEFLLANGASSLQMFGMGTMENPDADEFIKDGQELVFDDIKIKVLHTPGHTPGGVCLYVEEADSVITGDTIFLESIGRSDFPYADHGTLIGSINSKLLSLADETKVYPGHGPASSVGHERKYNPFL
jgi:glyoxylase-like metal-dependent hydrolase (beta-lactamase superfamily II)